MKRATFSIIALTLLFTSCIDDVAADDEENDNGNLKSTVSYKVNGKQINLIRESDVPQLPVIGITNDPEAELNVLFDDGTISFSFTGAYLGNSSRNYKEGFMDYVDPQLPNYHYADSEDQCNSDFFNFEIRKKPAGIASMPFMYRFTGTFSGRLVYYRGKPGGIEIEDPCSNPEFLEITDGKFDVVGLNDYQ